MSDPYIGEIRMFAGTFEPQGWMFCQGQTLSVAAYPALFSLLGTYYGGDGVTTFALPDLRGRFPVGTGQGGGRSSYQLGQYGGAQSVTVIAPQIPSHSHSVAAADSPTTTSAAGAFPAGWADAPYSSTAPSTALAPVQLAQSGGTLPHENRQPYLAMNFIICIDGIFPSREDA
ncbi:tail fiber protein [Leifsonia sp. NPDC080035]|uniref:Tail fiber protein n=1 Tax=Leifsonia sp. NPDC080035 TaxID=3143936 RepID=A0AAU7GH78_9MICO